MMMTDTDNNFIIAINGHSDYMSLVLLTLSEQYEYLLRLAVTIDGTMIKYV
jgi:hypothetical protein